MIRYLGILARVSSILARRSSILSLVIATTFNTILILALPRIPITTIYALFSSLAISLLLISELRSSLISFSKALHYYGGSKGDRLTIILYLSTIASIPGYSMAILLNNPYIIFINVIFSILVISNITSPRTIS
ncbi:MAG: hypothetical protein ACO2O0_08980 [Desulfurococcales archaeon]